jgi:hypothetical protein
VNDTQTDLVELARAILFGRGETDKDKRLIAERQEIDPMDAAKEYRYAVNARTSREETKREISNGWIN